MLIISKNISEKIDTELVEAIDSIRLIADEYHIPFFLVGAKARDIFFSLLFGIASRRATLDVDLGIKVNTWDEVAVLTESMTASSHFVKVSERISRYRHRNGTLIDIVPFGPVERPIGKVKWPASDAVMTTTGFDEAYLSAVTVRIRNSPPLDITVCTPPSMVILKLIAWDEKYPERTRDAQDIYFIMQQYIEAGNDARLYAEDSDLLEEEQFDYAKTSPRLLGRDLATIANSETLTLVLSLLERELQRQADSSLVADMVRGEYAANEAFQTALNLLNELKRGIMERRK
jgi:predicted nucleotidyltransferase